MSLETGCGFKEQEMDGQGGRGGGHKECMKIRPGIVAAPVLTEAWGPRREARPHRGPLSSRWPPATILVAVCVWAQPPTQASLPLPFTLVLLFPLHPTALWILLELSLYLMLIFRT